MARIKLNFFFDDDAQQGWSETYWMEAANIDAIFEGAGAGGVSRLEALVLGRRNVLGRSYFLRFVRGSDDAVLRDSRFAAYRAGPAQGLARIGTLTKAQDEQVFDAVNLRLSAASPTARRSFLMRGLPGGSIDATRQVSASFQTMIVSQFRAALLSTSCCIKQTEFLTPFGVAAIAVRPDNRSLTITLAEANIEIVAGSIVKLSDVPQLAYAKGLWRVKESVNGLTITTFPRKRRVIGTYPANGGAFLSRATINLRPIIDVQTLAATRKDTGRPSYVPRGRQSAQQA